MKIIAHILMIFLCVTTCLGQEKPLSFVALVANHAITHKDIIERIKMNAVMGGRALDKDFYENFVLSVYQDTVNQIVDENLLDEEVRQLSKLAPKFFGKAVMDTIVRQRESEMLKHIKMDKTTLSTILKERGIPYHTFYNQVRAQVYLERIILMMCPNVRANAQRMAKKALRYHGKGKYIYVIAEIVIYNQGSSSKEKIKDIYERIQRGESFQSLAIQYSQSSSRPSGGKLPPFFEGQADATLRLTLSKCEEGDILGPLLRKNPDRFVIVALLSKKLQAEMSPEELKEVAERSALDYNYSRMGQQEIARIRRKYKPIVKLIDKTVPKVTQTG